MMHDPPIHPGCTGKAQYASKADALHCIRKRKRGFRIKTKSGRSGMHPYRCSICKFFHIGSNPLR